jgi:RNA polymerase sigma factor (sigma-70 family)
LDHLTDQQLVRDYAEHRSEAAFAELVRRHVNLVYSAARRMVRDRYLAEDVAQGAFLALAQSAHQLIHRPVLSGWLHRTTQNLAANAVRSEVRRRHREEKAADMNDTFAPETDETWESIEKSLDSALESLKEEDRDALLLRYFERKSAREMAQTLGINDRAAQKRVNRALVRLRDRLAKSGVPTHRLPSAGTLALLVSAHSVQAAPVGLALTISTAATVAAGTLAATTTAITAAQTIAMTTLQKTIVVTALAVAVGTGIFEARRASAFRTQLETLQHQHEPLAGQIAAMQQQKNVATAKAATLAEENRQLQETAAEVHKLRAELTQLRAAQPRPGQPSAALNPSDPTVQNFLALEAQAEQIARHLQQMPEKAIPEIGLLTDVDWLVATKEAKFDADTDVRQTLSSIRSLAKKRLPMGQAHNAFIQANEGHLPNELSELKPYFQAALGETQIPDATLDAIFNRYTLAQTGKIIDLPPDAWIILEKAPVDKDYDTRAKFGNGRSTIFSTGLNQAGDPDDKSY